MYNTLDVNGKSKHIIDYKVLYEYQKMLNQWESTGINFKIIKEEFHKSQTGQNMMLYHIVKFNN